MQTFYSSLTCIGACILSTLFRHFSSTSSLNPDYFLWFFYHKSIYWHPSGVLYWKYPTAAMNNLLCWVGDIRNWFQKGRTWTISIYCIVFFASSLLLKKRKGYCDYCKLNTITYIVLCINIWKLFLFFFN